MGKFDSWAKSTSGNSRRLVLPPKLAEQRASVPIPAVAPGSVPAVVPAPHVPPAPPPPGTVRLVASMRPQVIVHPLQVGPTPRAAPSTRNVLVAPGGRDRYGELLAQLPAIDVPDLSGGVDAMKLAGRPEMAAMNKWTPSARYYNGVTDSTAPNAVDGHLGARYSETTGSVRSAQVAGRRSFARNEPPPTGL